MKSILVFVALLLASAAPGAFAARLLVPQTYPSIQQAVDAAQSGDSVVVAAGVYEETVDLKYGVTLLGAGIGQTIIDTRSIPRPFEDGGINVSHAATLVAGFEVWSELQYCGFRGNPGSNVDVEDCRFTGGAVGAYFEHGAIVRLKNCLMDHNYDGVKQDTSTGSLVNCTLVDNHTGIRTQFVQSQTIANCIIAGSTNLAVECAGGAAPALSCSCLWDNDGGNYVGCISGLEGQAGNISADPRFCGAVNSDYSFEWDSPCATGNSPGCSQIGALGVGCQVPPGGCCFIDGSCVTLLEGECAEQSGSWLGAESTCDPGPCPFEVLELASTSIAGIQSTPLSAGQWYEVIAEGVYCWDAGCNQADPEWFYAPQNGGWMEHQNPSLHPPNSFEVHIDDAPLDWEGSVDDTTWLKHTLSPVHRYRTFLLGAGESVKFHIADTFPYEHAGSFDWTGDNSGVLSVELTPVDLPGACCLIDGSCQSLAPSECLSLDGTFSGPNTTCGPNACPPPSGVGAIVTWGLNEEGQCDVPAPNADFVAVAAGEFHSLGLKSDGTIVAWGRNVEGQCDVPAPNADFVAMSAGIRHSLGLKSDGTIVAWGWNGFGQCNIPTPNSGFTAIACGGLHSLGLRSDGSIAAWGDNMYGACNVSAPNSSYTALAAGYEFSLGLKSDGSLRAWGRNSDGQCTVPGPNDDFVSMVGGWGHSIGLKSDGTIVAWGWNGHGQCDVPAPNADFVALAPSNHVHHHLTLKSDGAIVTWGYNEHGQCDVPFPDTEFVAVAGGRGHSLGLMAIASGACCLEDGACIATSEAGCDAPSVWQGANTACEPNPCPLPTGSCCQPDGTCVSTLEAACDSPAQWLGANTECDPNPCPPAGGACCLVGFCVSMTPEECGSFGGVYQGHGVICTPTYCETSGVEELLASTSLEPRSFPNPSTGGMRITFLVPSGGHVSLKVFDASGRSVRSLFDGERPPGPSSVEWDGRDETGREAPSGIYLMRVETAAGVRTGRATVAR